ncbi:MAG: bifunctional 5,10-methylenetetrahydrofolate dehydrogenase/5,10-methenyltetrahydrofolate cyclohydrolase [Chloroflexi bacterium]|uniref:bifunctional 5,10-methylenetetrahydrofolate dehydrogenase/5,10-methenyltetrahydrofolate cyclohydrolase n=1 Tax=Candidatus Flexifilum breve TaxID=3140694 RepID=UPI0031370FEA|nr:bifunctional 5,10-methylenetetrahydrofolate dehydrogenase/5,10-methenyltetrahydrofolate cyclohydrolase [Chloroflexota bacterium]
MSAQIIDGQAIADEIRTNIAAEVARFQAQFGYPPGLGVVLVGDNPASAQYVRMKRRACESAGMKSVGHILPASAIQAEVEAAVKALNDDPTIHGILVQLPLPPHIDEPTILSMVSLEKDVDGFHPINIGRLAMKGREPLFTPATPTGCMVLLERMGAQLEGANAVVIGRSNIVGMPVALMLMKANATVTVCHSRTRDLPDIVRRADVVIAAIGRPNYVKGNWLKPGAIVIDVGTNQIDDPTAPRGYRYVGDVEVATAQEVAGAITKVPGGVGPMTITLLMQNTLKSAWRSVGATT